MAKNAVVQHIDEIVLNGVKVQVRSMDLPLDSVKLDPTNPRVANTVAVSDFGTGANQQQRLEDLLWGDSDVRDLYRAILDNKGLVERIIVRNNLVVAEGNCRTAIYRRLRRNFPNDPSWVTIPARVLPADISDKQVAVLLGELHVGGKNEWSPFEKAGHIHKLATTFSLTQEEIAKLLRTSKTAVNHHIRAFDAMKNKYLPSYPQPSSVRKFSYFLELYKKPELRDWVAQNPEALDSFVRWVGTDRISRGEHVRTLCDIVSNPRALAAFNDEGSEAARKILQEDRPDLTSPLFKLMVEMTKALDQSRLDDVQRVRRDPTGGGRAVVRNLKESFARFLELCGELE